VDFTCGRKKTVVISHFFKYFMGSNVGSEAILGLPETGLAIIPGYENLITQTLICNCGFKASDLNQGVVYNQIGPINI
jgi:hypothetical protein